MVYLPSLFAASLLVFSVSADYRTDNQQIALAKAVEKDVNKGITDGAGEVFDLSSNFKFNNKRVYTDMPFGAVKATITLYSDNLNLIENTVARVSKKRGYDFETKCKSTKDFKTKSNLAGTKCKVTMRPSKLTKISLEVMEITNKATSVNVNSKKQSTKCDAVSKDKTKCIFDYEPENYSDAKKSKKIVKQIRAAIEEMANRAAYDQKVNCDFNSKKRIVDNKNPGQIHCEITIKPQKMTTSEVVANAQSVVIKQVVILPPAPAPKKKCGIFKRIFRSNKC